MLIEAILVPVVWLLKSIAYVAVFRIRTIQVTYLSCLIIAGAPILLVFIPLPLPGFLLNIIGVGLAVYLTMYYTGVSLIPEGLFIPLGIEVAFKLAVWLISGLFQTT